MSESHAATTLRKVLVDSGLSKAALCARAGISRALNLTADPADPERVLSALPRQVQIHGDAAGQLRTESQVRLWWRSSTLDTPIDLFLSASPTYHRLVIQRARQRSSSGRTSKC